MTEPGLNMSRKRYYAYVPLTLLVLLLVSYDKTEFDLRVLFSDKSGQNVWSFLKSMFPPDLSQPFMEVASRAAIETVAISIMGTVFGIAIALTLTCFATGTLLYSGILHDMESTGLLSKGIKRVVHVSSRLLLNLFRAVPELVWALIFILAVGLGPFPGVLALAVHTGGILGKLYSEFLENVDSQPLEALQSVGSTRLGILLYGMLPQALPHFVSYTLYRWEVNIRAATILGFVGAGGIGQQIYINMNLTFYDKLLTLVILIFLMVTLTDGLSAFVRRRIVQGGNESRRD